MALELAQAGHRMNGRAMVLTDAYPVIEALQREVEIVLCLKFDNGQPAVFRDAENVQQAAIARTGDGRHLRVYMPRVELGNQPRRRGALRCGLGLKALRIRLF